MTDFVQKLPPPRIWFLAFAAGFAAAPVAGSLGIGLDLCLSGELNPCWKVFVVLPLVGVAIWVPLTLFGGILVLYIAATYYQAFFKMPNWGWFVIGAVLGGFLSLILAFVAWRGEPFFWVFLFSGAFAGGASTEVFGHVFRLCARRSGISMDS